MLYFIFYYFLIVFYIFFAPTAKLTIHLAGIHILHPPASVLTLHPRYLSSPQIAFHQMCSTVRYIRSVRCQTTGIKPSNEFADGLYTQPNIYESRPKRMATCHLPVPGCNYEQQSNPSRADRKKHKQRKLTRITSHQAYGTRHDPSSQNGVHLGIVRNQRPSLPRFPRRRSSSRTIGLENIAITSVTLTGPPESSPKPPSSPESPSSHDEPLFRNVLALRRSVSFSARFCCCCIR